MEAEDLGEEAGLDLAQHDVAVGDRQRPAAAVTGWPRIGPRRVRPDPEAGTVEMQDRAATRRHRVDAHHRGAHAHPGHLGLEGALILAVKVGHIGRGAAHVEADDFFETGQGGGLHHADDAARRTGQDAVLALEFLGFGEAAVGLHKHQPRVAGFGGHPVHITAQDRRQVGVDHRGVAARYQFHQRADVVGSRDLGKAGLAGQVGDRPFMGRETVTVHENNGDRTDTVVVGRFQFPAGCVKVGGHEHLAFSGHPFGDFGNPLIEQFRQYDPQLEQLRPVLVTDAQGIPKAPGGEQQRAVTLAFQEGVGGHRGAHLDGGNVLRRDRLARGETEDMANAFDGGIVVLFRVVRQQFMGQQAAIGTPRHDIGKSAAAVDPELPGAGFGVCHRIKKRGLLPAMQAVGVYFTVQPNSPAATHHR